jgi:ATP-dependent RNA helicase RhlE
MRPSHVRGRRHSSHAVRRATSSAPSPLANEPTVFTDATGAEPVPFEALGFHDDILDGVRDRGFERTTPIQSAVLPLVAAGRDLIGCAATGTGKTAAFVLPLLDRLRKARDGSDAGTASGGLDVTSQTRVLVLSPTRELAAQIADDVQGFAYHAGVDSVVVHGGVPMNPQSRALESGVAVVVATPGRLLDHMRSGSVRFGALDVLVIDEADRMLDMGFWPDIRRIVAALPSSRQTLLFSATMPEEVMQFARAIMREPAFVQVGERNAAACTITHAVENVPAAEKTAWLVRFLRRESGPVLVFVRTKAGADRLARQLIAARLRATALHADREQRERTAAVEGFRAGRFKVLVATDIAARGLDVDGITHVVNYDVPHSPEDYVHRAGRTGRALATGTALTLVSRGEERALQAIAARVPMTTA